MTKFGSAAFNGGDRGSAFEKFDYNPQNPCPPLGKGGIGAAFRSFRVSRRGVRSCFESCGRLKAKWVPTSAVKTDVPISRPFIF
jgi:hypothetical protein